VRCSSARREPQARGRILLSRLRKALAAEFEIHQAGDAEAALLFDPGDAVEVRLAIRLIDAKKRRAASPNQLRVLKASRESLSPPASPTSVILGDASTV
jgi:hypothetical protein